MENRSIPQSGTQDSGGTPEILGSRFRTQFKPDDYNDDEWNNEPSKTVPDQTLTVQELLLNHSRGINSEVYENEGQFLGDVVIPTIYDLNDLADARENLNQQFNDLQERLEAEQKLKDDENQTNTGSDSSAPTDGNLSPETGGTNKE